MNVDLQVNAEDCRLTFIGGRQASALRELHRCEEIPMKEMINELRAINRLLERVRTLAYKGQTPKQMGRMLDDVHYLLNSVIETTEEEPFDRERFIAYLQQIEADYDGVNGIAEGYQEATVHAATGGKIRFFMPV